MVTDQSRLDQSQSGLQNNKVMQAAGEPVESGRLGAATQLTAISRLVMIVPNQDVDVVKISHELWSLASRRIDQILLLTIVDKPDSEMEARRRLVIIAALTQDPHIRVQIQVARESSWIKAVRKVFKAGDLVVCPTEKTIGAGIGRHLPLASVLSDRVKIPVYLLPGLYEDERLNWHYYLRHISYWAVLVAILGGFFEFDAIINSLARGWKTQLLLVMVTLIEFGCIYFWMSIAG